MSWRVGANGLTTQRSGSGHCLDFLSTARMIVSCRSCGPGTSAIISCCRCTILDYIAPPPSQQHPAVRQERMVFRGRDRSAEPADGTLVCDEQGRNFCGRYSVDYGVLLPHNRFHAGDDEYDMGSFEPGLDEIQPMFHAMSLGAAIHPAAEQPLINFARFTPPHPCDTPTSLFDHAANEPWLVRRSNASEFLIYADGACRNNGYRNAKGGWAFVYSVRNDEFTRGVVSRALENTGPTGAIAAHTSNRAELRAVIAALEFHDWASDGWKRLVIATDSSYVVSGITSWVSQWSRNDWRTSDNRPVMNRDLWERLLERLRFLDDIGNRHCQPNQSHQNLDFEVAFWRIDRQLNDYADSYARAACDQPARRTYTKIIAPWA